MPAFQMLRWVRDQIIFTTWDEKIFAVLFHFALCMCVCVVACLLFFIFSSSSLNSFLYLYIPTHRKEGASIDVDSPLTCWGDVQRYM